MVFSILDNYWAKETFDIFNNIPFIHSRNADKETSHPLSLSLVIN